MNDFNHAKLSKKNPIVPTGAEEGANIYKKTPLYLGIRQFYFIFCEGQSPETLVLGFARATGA